MDYLEKSKAVFNVFGNVGYKNLKEIDCFRTGEFEGITQELIAEKIFNSRYKFAVELLNATGQDPKDWRGREFQLGLYSEAHRALASYSISENTEGRQKTLTFMQDKTIPHNPEFEQDILENIILSMNEEIIGRHYEILKSLELIRDDEG